MVSVLLRLLANSQHETLTLRKMDMVGICGILANNMFHVAIARTTFDNGSKISWLRKFNPFPIARRSCITCYFGCMRGRCLPWFLGCATLAQRNPCSGLVGYHKRPSYSACLDFQSACHRIIL